MRKYIVASNKIRFSTISVTGSLKKKHTLMDKHRFVEACHQNGKFLSKAFFKC